MPNCDYYATIDDHKEILDFIFSSPNLEVYELYSDFETALIRFDDSEHVLNQFNRANANGSKWTSVHLNLRMNISGENFEPAIVKLDPIKCNGKSFRYTSQGFDMIQLYLSIQSSATLDDSHSNHFTQKSSEKWADSPFIKSQIDAIDFKLISSFSSRLNREIRKMGVAKIGSRILTQSAYELWNLGYKLTPYHKDSTTLVMI